MEKNIKPGDIVFAYDFEISRSGSRFSKILEPTELRVESISPNNKWALLDNHKSYPISRIFSTYLEAKESWNLELNNVLEKLRCDYERRVRNIKKRLL